MAVEKQVKTAYGVGEVIGFNDSNKMYEVQLKFGIAYMKRAQFVISAGQDVLIWHLPLNYKIKRIWNLLGKKYTVNVQRNRMVSISVESEAEAEELCKRFNNTKMDGDYVGFRFDEPGRRRKDNQRKRKEKGRRKRAPRPLRLLLTPSGFGRQLETKKRYCYVSTPDGVKLLKKLDCQEVHFVQTKNGDTKGFVQKLHHNGHVDVQTDSGAITVPFTDLDPIQTVETAYGHGEVKRIGRKEMLQVQLDFGTLYSLPCNLSPVAADMKASETEI